MRTLTARQRKYLDTLVGDSPNISGVDDLTPEQWNTLESMNDTEILWQETERYLTDKYFEQAYK